MAVDFSADQKEVYRFAGIERQGKKTNDSTFSIAFEDRYIRIGGISVLLIVL